MATIATHAAVSPFVAADLSSSSSLQRINAQRYEDYTAQEFYRYALFSAHLPPDGLSEQDVAEIWRYVASNYDQRNITKKIGNLLCQNFPARIWEIPARHLTSRIYKRGFPRCFIIALRANLFASHIHHNYTQPMTDIWSKEIWHLCTWTALSWWVEASKAPEHLIAAQLERDLGL